ncbi:MAG: AlpA family transcriptional regulator [Burkholderiales bacterium]|nr:AlpA family transcriptional regulator [Burkholderiales bacterium]
MQHSVNSSNSLPSEGLAKLPAVMSATGLSRSTLYARIKLGEFPAPVKLGDRAVAWPVESVRAWIAARIEAANDAPNAGKAGAQ